MSLKPKKLEDVPEATCRIAHRAFPKGTLAMVLRDELANIYTDEYAGPFVPETRAWC
jgi:transposase